MYAAPRVFTTPPGRPFLPTLIDALLDGRILDGFAGAAHAATIFLPTRRAARAFAALFAERAGGGARGLSRLAPLGEAAEGGGVEDGAAFAPPIAPLERRLILTRLVQTWSAQVDR